VNAVLVKPGSDGRKERVWNASENAKEWRVAAVFDGWISLSSNMTPA
jgi:hypothetical protein